jgi:hypothetical protein
MDAAELARRVVATGDAHVVIRKGPFIWYDLYFEPYDGDAALIPSPSVPRTVPLLPAVALHRHLDLDTDPDSGAELGDMPAEANLTAAFREIMEGGWEVVIVADNDDDDEATDIGNGIKRDRDDVDDSVERLLARVAELEADNERLRRELAAATRPKAPSRHGVGELERAAEAAEREMEQAVATVARLRLEDERITAERKVANRGTFWDNPNRDENLARVRQYDQLLSENRRRVAEALEAEKRAKVKRTKAVNLLAKQRRWESEQPE